MLTIVPRVALFVTALLVLMQGVSWADAGGAVPTDLGIWPAVSFTACSLALWALRRFSSGGFLHTPTGVVIGTVVAGVINAVQPIIASHGLDSRAILFAALGAVGAGLAMSNPSGTPASKMEKAPVAIALLMAIGLSACSLPKPIPTNLDGGVIPTSGQQYEKAFVNCLESEGVTDATGVGQKIWNILTQGGFSVNQLEQKIESALILVAGTGGEAVVSCAVLSWFQLNPVSITATPTASQAAARVFQAKHLKALKHNGPTPTVK